MIYLDLKHFHMTCAGLSGLLFLLRGIWMLRESPLSQAKWVRVVPHIIDSLLLGSALILAFWSHQYPGQAPWLTAKLGALCVYIGLGSIALKRARTVRQRAVALFGALTVFSYIVAVAVTKSVVPFAA